MLLLQQTAAYFRGNFSISAALRTFPDATTFSLTTSAGMDMAPQAMIFSIRRLRRDPQVVQRFPRVFEQRVTVPASAEPR